MVLASKGKNNRRSGTVQMDYLIHIQEIKPWPPSQSLISFRSVLIQWENGERSSGSTNLVSPSLGSVIGEGKIEFNESFRLPVTLVRDTSLRNGDADVFLKNCLEFNLYEPRRDKTAKGQLLGTAIIDLADSGMLKETLSISVPMNCKRNYRNTDQPLLFIKIEPVKKKRARSLLKDSLSKGSNGGDSISTLMNKEYAEEAEVASFTDDDVSSHSSVAAATICPQSSGCMHPEIEVNGAAQKTGSINKEHPLASETGVENLNMMQQETYERLERSSSYVSSIDVSSDVESPLNGHASVTDSPGHRSVTTQKYASSSSSDPSPSLEENSMSRLRHSDHEMDKQNLTEDESVAQDAKDRVLLSNITSSLGGLGIVMKGNVLKSERLKHVKSVRSPADSARSFGLHGSNHHAEVKEISIVGDAQTNEGNVRSSDKKDAKIYPNEARDDILDSKIEHLENKIKMLEGELREAAAIEAALYSVVAEHGTSMSKVHAPARRLSRLYLHACKENLQARRSGAAKSAVSGLVLVAKTCGNDVARLTFWFSNSVVLRTIISQTSKDVAPPNPVGSGMRRKNEGEGNGKIASSLVWKGLSSRKNENTAVLSGGFANWDDSEVFISALEKVEAWIFSRIVESVWWQTLTPHMQPVDAKVTNKDVGSSSKKSYSRISSSCDQELGNLSLDVWKSAFREACERLCPIRARGHECGCLSVLPRLIMEQCVARLDVAMFNAILRESADDMPTDPVSDPISDAKVLPIPPGKSSFGAGAKLKTAIGNWSRWLTDLFGMDDDDSYEDKDDLDNGDGSQNTSCKSFHLLSALSDLLMLPKDMLLNASIRKEVCPMFSAPLIRKILDNFIQDEFCPDPIPAAVFEALDSQDDLEDEKDSVNNFPCTAAPIFYSPPPATTIASIIGDIGSEAQLRRSRSSVIRKSYTSDDELDELNSPLSSIISNGTSSPSELSARPSWKLTETDIESAVRYELLRDVWMNSE